MSARAIEAEVSEVRDELTTLVAELDRRRHELFDVKLQLRRHAWRVGLTALAVGATAAAGVALRRRRARRAQALTVRGRRIGQAVGRLIEHPERVAVEPTFVEKVGAAVAVYLVKVVLDRMLARR